MYMRHAYLRALLICCLVSRGVSKSFDVVWVSPAEGMIFKPGDTIIGRWTSKTALVSPGFSLCEVADEPIVASGGFSDVGDEAGICGAAIWPEVQETESGYMIKISAPEVLEIHQYNLKMEDGFGNVFASPIFNLGSGQPAATNRDEVHATSTRVSRLMDKTILRSSATPKPAFGASVLNNTSVIPPPTSVPSAAAMPGVLVSRRPVSTAAFVIPLSVVSSITLIAGLLCMRTRRKKAGERKKELKPLMLSGQSSRESCKVVGEVERTFNVLTRTGLSSYSNSPGPLPLFMATRVPRPVTRDPYTPLPCSFRRTITRDDTLGLHYQRHSNPKIKSWTSQYTVSGMVDEPMAVPPARLPAGPLPLYIRTGSPRDDRSLPVLPHPIPSLTADGYETIAAKWR